MITHCSLPSLLSVILCVLITFNSHLSIHAQRLNQVVGDHNAAKLNSLTPNFLQSNGNGGKRNKAIDCRKYAEKSHPQLRDIDDEEFVGQRLIDATITNIQQLHYSEALQCIAVAKQQVSTSGHTKKRRNDDQQQQRSQRILQRLKSYLTLLGERFDLEFHSEHGVLYTPPSMDNDGFEISKEQLTAYVRYDATKHHDTSDTTHQSYNSLIQQLWSYNKPYAKQNELLYLIVDATHVGSEVNGRQYAEQRYNDSQRSGGGQQQQRQQQGQQQQQHGYVDSLMAKLPFTGQDVKNNLPSADSLNPFSSSSSSIYNQHHYPILDARYIQIDANDQKLLESSNTIIYVKCEKIVWAGYLSLLDKATVGYLVDATETCDDVDVLLRKINRNPEPVDDEPEQQPQPQQQQEEPHDKSKLAELGDIVFNTKDYKQNRADGVAPSQRHPEEYQSDRPHIKEVLPAVAAIPALDAVKNKLPSTPSVPSSLKSALNKVTPNRLQNQQQQQQQQQYPDASYNNNFDNQSNNNDNDSQTPWYAVKSKVLSTSDQRHLLVLLESAGGAHEWQALSDGEHYTEMHHDAMLYTWLHKKLIGATQEAAKEHNVNVGDHADHDHVYIVKHALSTSDNQQFHADGSGSGSQGLHCISFISDSLTSQGHNHVQIRQPGSSSAKTVHLKNGDVLVLSSNAEYKLDSDASHRLEWYHSGDGSQTATQ